MKTAAALASALGYWAVACIGLHEARADASPPYAEVYQRATNQFNRADFYKPAEARTNDLAFTLAPLLLPEADGAQETLDRFGALSLSNGVPVLDRSRPAIYWQADTVLVKGKALTRFTYLWCYALATAWPCQGIRLTLNSAGQPVIWEVLADPSGAELIFVAQSLEAAAAAQFGKALPGRRYAIERSPEEAPRVIVARVIDDGPVAMGPIVYLSARTRTVSTLICRCMPAQAKTLLSTTAYDLLPFQAVAMNALITPATIRPHALWPADTPGAARLEKCLRLPAF